MVALLSSLPDPPPEFEAAHSPRPRVVVCGPYASRGARERVTGGGHWKSRRRRFAVVAEGVTIGG